MKIKTKNAIQMSVKELSENGSFVGRLSVYGELDQGGDIVERGAFTKTIQERGNTVPLLWQHKSDVPIGTLTLDDSAEALNVTGQLLMTLPEAQKAYLLIKSQIVKGLSIGFETIKDSIENGVRHLKEIRLHEGSIVTFPMLESALITSVKSANRETKGDFNEELTEIQLQDAAYQMRCALSCALSSLVWSGLSKEEIVSASDTVIQQFRDAYMTYIPQYIDMLTEMYGEMKTWNEKRLETKSGRKISAATKEKLASAHEQMKSAVDTISALLADEADEPITTSDTKAAAIPAAHEPTDSHSEALASLRALIPK